MSKKLPKENLKKVSGAGSKGSLAAGDAVLGKKGVIARQQFAPEGQIEGRNLDKGLTGKKIIENE